MLFILKINKYKMRFCCTTAVYMASPAVYMAEVYMPFDISACSKMTSVLTSTWAGLTII